MAKTLLPITYNTAEQYTTIKQLSTNHMVLFFFRLTLRASTRIWSALQFDTAFGLLAYKLVEQMIHSWHWHTKHAGAWKGIRDFVVQLPLAELHHF